MNTTISGLHHVRNSRQENHGDDGIHIELYTGLTVEYGSHLSLGEFDMQSLEEFQAHSENELLRDKQVARSRHHRKSRYQ